MYELTDNPTATVSGDQFGRPCLRASVSIDHRRYEYTLDSMYGLRVDDLDILIDPNPVHLVGLQALVPALEHLDTFTRGTFLATIHRLGQVVAKDGFVILATTNTGTELIYYGADRIYGPCTVAVNGTEVAVAVDRDAHSMIALPPEQKTRLLTEISEAVSK